MHHIGGNFCQEKIFAISPPVLAGKIFFFVKFLFRVNDCIEDMVTFTALEKIYSTEYFCDTKVPVLGEIFV